MRNGFLVGASGATSAALRYDPLGRLYETSGTAAGVTRFLYDGDELVGEFDGAGTLLRGYIHGLGSDDPVVWYEASLSQLRWLHADERGSIIAVSGTGGAVLGINAYDDYGVPAGMLGGQANLGRFQYTGQAWIPELGMYYYKARIYSPTLGRFLQTDPIGYADQINLYAYVGNDPVNARDPSGECSEDAIIDRCEISYEAPQVAESARSTGSYGMEEHFVEGTGTPLYFDPKRYLLGQEEGHGNTVQSALNGEIRGSSLSTAATEARTTGEGVSVNFQTRATSYSGIGLR